MEPNQTPSQVCARVLAALDPILAREQPDLMLVQGDTTTALAGALAGFHRRIPVAHVEAGLRSGDASSPYPEEMNRRLITQLASYHFAATARNRAALLAENVASDSIFVTGNPVVEALKTILERASVSAELKHLIEATKNLRRVVLTTHRRESFGEVLAGNLRALRRFIETHEDVALIFPVHPNPAVARPAKRILAGQPRVHLLEPLGYGDFLFLLSHAWLIVSDSGGVQEEAPSLGKPLLILRDKTERPEAIEAGIARLVGGRPHRLEEMLAEAYSSGDWIDAVKKVKNPFGRNDSGRRIARIIGALLGEPATRPLVVN
jgi:UDP-N-acetylglucosamine 2-epimerase (non-hydrolysing)